MSASEGRLANHECEQMDLDARRNDLPPARLERALEVADGIDASPSFFLSRAWLETTLHCWGLRAHYRLEPVDDRAFALLGKGTDVRHGFVRSRVLALNQAADPWLDQVWVERNGFFGGSQASFAEHLERLLCRLAPDSEWDELRIGGVVETAADSARLVALRHGLDVQLYARAPHFWVDLDLIRRNYGGDYVSALTPNTRQQLRRALRAMERDHGPVRVRVARSVDEALHWFDLTAPLHRARWPGTERGLPSSGFENPGFVTFHRRLICEGFKSNGIRYLCLTLADRPTAFLYNFIRHGQVQFYLSGIDYSIGPQYKPGLVAHLKAIELAIERGDSIYDFLGGDARYKRSLCSQSGTMEWLVLRRRRWKLRAEAFARNLRRRIRATGS